MREQILNFLFAKQGEYVSGEELSKILGVSRAAVWKHINRLKEEGYRIESQTRLGHRLENKSGPFNKYELKRNLGTARFGCDIVVRPEVTSTNDLAKELARTGAQAGTVIVAEVQQGGRGRRGRHWISPKGGIWMSAILRPTMELKNVANYTLLAGVAVTHAINQVTGLNVGIKWPNDVLLQGKKVGGILTEVIGEWQAVEFLVLGIGVNANLSEASIATQVDATSLQIALGKPVDLVVIIQEILRQIERLENLLLAGGNSAILQEWRRLAVCLNCEVVIKETGREWMGQSVDIDADGALLVEDQQGKLVKIYSGDVSLRGAQGKYRF
ncbi:MAG: biotin--[acetyl-CoA-carboxylase] ligase [Peptococcaceae bacterium]|nr:biotin--[acetyl-CoA-carboxylase] ligase [Peptococcaceae bacterium]